jgi:dipeptidyl aminopeptidase/acylaminoacyl peptidase
VAYDIPTGEIRFIGKSTEGFEGDDVLYVDPSGEWLLLSIQRTLQDWPSVFRVDLATNKMRQVVKSMADVWEWYADDKGVVRVGAGFLERKWFMVYRKTDVEGFRRIVKANYDDEEAALDALHFIYESDEGFVLSNERTGRFGVYRYNFAKRELGEPVYEHPVVDVSDFTVSEDGKSVKAAWYTDDRDRVIWFDPTLKQHQETIDAALPDRHAWILSRSVDDTRMLVWTGSESDPGNYYIYVPEAGMMKRIAKVNERINRKQLAPTRYVTYRARDGLDIPAYLTLPIGREPRNLPLVILPHGGPFGIRGRLAYDPEVQFLANRGYAVLQPNFRGSGGYGKAHYDKGEGQWGRRMQDDLDDGMDWLVKSGTVDPKRVCVIGASYGGYAALWGVTRNPERYRCAASFAGVTDLKRQLNYDRNFLSSSHYRSFRSKVRGDEDFDMDSVSPLKQVERLRIPVLLAHGKDDTNVPYKQSLWYAEALKKAGKAHEFYTYEDEGHGFSSAENLKHWLDPLDAFLARHNPAD